jgi:hypothetical protein
MGTSTKAQVFVIESLTLEDERRGRFEGDILRRILSLSGKQCEYYYIRTVRELKRLICEFAKSKYRYLHLSCHADSKGMATTFDSLDFGQLAEIVTPHLNGRRVFLSACEMANSRLATKLLVSSGCYSVMGPTEDILFSDAALLWSSFYHLMFRTNHAKMQREAMEAHARSTADLFQVPLALFFPEPGSAGGIGQVKIRPTAV